MPRIQATELSPSVYDVEAEFTRPSTVVFKNKPQGVFAWRQLVFLRLVVQVSEVSRFVNVTCRISFESNNNAQCLLRIFVGQDQIRTAVCEWPREQSD